MAMQSHCGVLIPTPQHRCTSWRKTVRVPLQETWLEGSPASGHPPPSREAPGGCPVPPRRGPHGGTAGPGPRGACLVTFRGGGLSAPRRSSFVSELSPGSSRSFLALFAEFLLTSRLVYVPCCPLGSWGLGPPGCPQRSACPGRHCAGLARTRCASWGFCSLLGRRKH